MLEHMSSRELSQWQAYEKIAGHVGPVYEHQALRQIASLLDGSEKAKPFPTPVELANYRPPEQSDDDAFMALEALIPEG